MARARKKPGCCCSARRSPRASTTSIWKKTSPARFRRFGKTKRIISYHNFRKTPDDLRELHDRLAALDADIVKIATMANAAARQRADAGDDAGERRRRPSACAWATSARRRASWPASSARRSPTPRSTTSGRSRPGSSAIKQMNEIYRYEQINPDTAVYGVIADPIGHSLSPHVHNAAFGDAGHRRGVCAVPRAGRRARPVHGRRAAAGHQGPERHDSAQGSDRQVLTKVDPAVKGIGAVNTVVFEDGEVLGYNTDYNAAMDCLEMHASATIGADPSPLNGQARAGAGRRRRRPGRSCTACERRGAKTTIACRTLRAGRAAGRRSSTAKAVDWEARHSADVDIIINCTPVGMHPNVDESPFDKIVPQAGDARVRHGLQSRDDAAGQGSPVARLPHRSPASRCSSARRCCSSCCSPARKRRTS